MNLNSLQNLFISELNDMYDAEIRIAAALPEMAASASSQDLCDAFTDHLEETRDQIMRLERVFQMMNTSYDGTVCHGTVGLLREGAEIISTVGDPSTKDAALIAAAQRVEHYEIAVYGTLCAMAKELNLGEIANILSMSLEEEGSADKRLTKLAEGGFFTGGINQDASKAA